MNGDVHGISEAQQEPTCESYVVLKATVCVDAIVWLPRIEVAHFEPGADREFANNRNTFEVDERLGVDPPSEFQCSRAARAGYLDISCVWLCGTEIGIASAEQKPWLQSSISMKLDPYVGRKKEVRIFRADVCGGVTLTSRGDARKSRPP